MTISLVALVMGYILDLIFGDPYWMPHPVRFIGNLISILEKVIRRFMPKTKRGEYIGGIILTVMVVSISMVIPLVIILMAKSINTYLALTVETFMCYQILATKSLKVESMKVYDELAKNDLPSARKAVSMIVGRDTKDLTFSGVAKAAVETVAENTSDGIIAPMIFIAIGGAPMGFFYKAINTMDSMVGYKNEKYMNFGRFAAKLDDVVNYLPARISAYQMILSSFFLRYDYKNAFKIYKRDRYNHASPNSAQTESVCAGALDIQLAGNAYYFGKLYEKPTIGDNIREINYDDIKKANRLLYCTSFISIVIISIIKITIILMVQ
ncbi:adenosylcobinamide-phosphate synthase CbiB [Clostridium sp.]|uniref:adenosylcobinamide-phosphate synthase CbiB n=1 Tax=Clostridium sp. TaxID=1506 RepID=UPI002672C8B2|nr:adenosylcobinamide-phosphate synthase CbiB [Clostridium sp.]MCI7030553.1 adenosylcobinamide-phosphate synthase CbiB [Clostridium sp.]